MPNGFLAKRRMCTIQAQLEVAYRERGWADVGLLAAVSGGADSVAMLRGLAAAWQKLGGAGRLMVAHFNHGLRGEASDLDQQFVAELAAALDLPCFLGSNTSQQREDVSEETARAARYEFLVRTAHENGARIIATAHTADDQVETVLHRIIRGAGVAGLAGIPASREISDNVFVVRPLLNVRRAEIIAYLKQLEQPFRTDASNNTAVYTRNKIRLQLLPQLREQYNPQIDDALLQLSTISHDYQQLLNTLTAPLLQTAVRCEPSGALWLQCDVLQETPQIVLVELLKQLWHQQQWPAGRMGHDQWRRLASLITAQQAPTETFPGGVRAEKKDGQLQLTRPSSPSE